MPARALLEGGPYDTIVVDDASDTPLASICEEIGPCVRTIRRTNGGPATARNTGAAPSDAENLFFADDDCLPRPDWILQLLAAHGTTPMRLVGGYTRNALDRNVLSAASQSLCTYLYDYYHGTGSQMSFFASNYICCYRMDFLAIGGFDESFSIAAAEDRDFGLRRKDNGGHLVHARDAAIDHAHDFTLTSFWKQHANYGRGARHVHLTLDEDYLRLLQSFLIVLSQVAMVSGYFGAVRKERRGNSTTSPAQ